MSKITFWGDFKANSVEHLNLSGELTLLLNESELNVVNFEAPLHSNGKPIQKSGPNISQHKDAPEWLETRGFNAISLANNHTMDYGEEGLNATLQAFKTAAVMGAGRWEEAYKSHLFHLSNGIKVRLVCCTHNEFGTLTDSWSDKNRAGCACAQQTDIQQVIMGG